MIYIAKTKDRFYVGADMFCNQPRSNFAIFWYANNLCSNEALDFTRIPIACGRKLTEEQAYKCVADLLRHYEGSAGFRIFDEIWRVLSDMICLCELDSYGNIENCITLT